MSHLYPDCAAGGRPVPNALSPAERQKLVVSVIPWCKKAAREQVQALERIGRAADFEELESEAYVAACQAAEFYREGKGATFLSYARTWIANRFREATDTRRTVQAGHLACPEIVPEPELAAEDGPDTYTPTADEERMLRVLDEPARTIVRMVVFEGLSPDQVALQMAGQPYYVKVKGRTVKRTVGEVKDVKLIIRNSVEALGKYMKAEDAANLFTLAGVAEVATSGARMVP